MKKDKEKFWLENPVNLFSNTRVLPKQEMSLEDQMNSISRLVVFIFLILFLLGYKQSILFLILSFIFIIILYYLQKSKMATCENFTPLLNTRQVQKINSLESLDSPLSDNIRPIPKQEYVPQNFNVSNISNDININNINNIKKRQQYIAKTEELYDDFLNQNRYNVKTHPSSYNQQIEQATTIEPNQSFFSSNQKLVGGANPKTKIRPVVVAQAYDYSYWKDNDFIMPAQINQRSVQDFYGSGYYVDQEIVPENSGNCDNGRCGSRISVSSNCSLKEEDKKKEKIIENFEYLDSSPVNPVNYSLSSSRFNMYPNKSCTDGNYSSSSEYITPIDLENGDFVQFEKKDFKNLKNIRDITKTTGDVDDSLGYDPTNLYYNLPTNYPATNCQRTTNLSDINDQIFTSTIVPGVYYKNTIIEPISSNIGISFDQQIPPRQVSYDKFGNKIYTGMDPRLYKPLPEKPRNVDVPSNFDVYDPRSNGYGTAYRSYTDKLTGQPRFFYDDVDAIRRPNYIIRSEVDFLDKADTYGPIRSCEEEMDINKKMRKLADTSFTEDCLDFRTDMMTRLMRKRNAELWQTRMAPKTSVYKK